MIDLNDVSIFVQVVEAKSFSRAAADLGLPRATVSRRVARLEDALGVRLLHRSTRTLGLTDAGRRYFEQCRPAMAAVAGAGAEIAGGQEVPRGTVRISAPADASLFLTDSITQFLKLNPQVKAELLLTDDRLKLVAERIDVAIRMGELADSSLIARRIGESRRVMCASSDYLVAAGRPLVPADLASHQCIVHGSSVEGASWVLQGPEGRLVVPLNARLAVNTMAFALNAAIAGLGIAMLPEPVAAAALRDGRLITLLEDFLPPRGIISIVYPSNRNLSSATKALIDYATGGNRTVRMGHAAGPR